MDCRCSYYPVDPCGCDRCGTIDGKCVTCAKRQMTYSEKAAEDASKFGPAENPDNWVRQRD